jgi:hypothetical protein
LTGWADVTENIRRFMAMGVIIRTVINMAAGGLSLNSRKLRAVAGPIGQNSKKRSAPPVSTVAP